MALEVDGDFGVAEAVLSRLGVLEGEFEGYADGRLSVEDAQLVSFELDTTAGGEGRLALFTKSTMSVGYSLSILNLVRSNAVSIFHNLAFARAEVAWGRTLRVVNLCSVRIERDTDLDIAVCCEFLHRDGYR